MTTPSSERAEAIRTLYLQVGNAFAAAGVVTAYMVATAWPFTPHRIIAAWLAVQLATQVARLGVVLAYRRAAPADADLDRWAQLYAIYMCVAGVMWGATIFLFYQPAEPITLALTLCGLYGISGGSVPVNAYNPPGLYLFVGTIFTAVLARMLVAGDASHIALGLASLAFAGILILFCRTQARTLMDGFRIRFENRVLLDELIVQKGAADAARTRAEQANIGKSQLLAAASHDLRQPLYALSLFTASLEGLRLDAQGKAVVASIQSSVGALEELFNRLLDLSRLETGAIVAERTPVAVEALLARLVQSFAPVAADRGLALRLGACSGVADSDAVLLEQILGNLLANAIRYTERGGILVGARRRGGAIRFEVWDTGVGIAAEDQARIFGEFIQLGNAERDRRKGLGLGLAIAQRGAELLGGTITLSSRPRRGSCFAFDQPVSLSQPPSAESAPVGLPDASVKGRSVMVVEDDADVRAALALLFAQWGVDCTAAASAEQALAMAADVRPDLALIDFRLGHGWDGLRLATALRDHWGADAPAMALVTADSNVEVRDGAAALGLPLLHKPISAARLRALLARSARSSSA